VFRRSRQAAKKDGRICRCSHEESRHEELVQATGYTGTSGSFGEAVMKLRGLELIGEEKKQWCASSYFFESTP
jgi:hypothetical protein